ncbi:MAG: hypothetical protein IJJ99_00705 [Oscillospiraceae bacterium]|nr:hypothetical protein [Oscillospiraceae bacterium]
MTALNEIGARGLWYLFCLTALALVLMALLCLIQTVRCGRRRGRAALAAGTLLLGFGVFVVLLDCAFVPVLSPEDYALVRPFQWCFFALPWLWYAIAELLVAALLLLQFKSIASYRRTHLTPDAIRETLDLLPEGVAVSRQDGTVLLCNLKMNELVRALTGAGLSDAGRFWTHVLQAGQEQNGQYWVQLPSESVWQFEKGTLSMEDGAYVCLRATDVTERWRIVKDLEAKHAHLQDVRRRMQAVSDLSGDMFVAQEEANARVALHNQLGQVLLMGKRLIEHPENTDAEIVRLTTKQMNGFLLGEAETPAPEKETTLQDAISAASSIGVAVELRGTPPQDEGLLRLLPQAIRECAANTVKHAQGDRLTVGFAPDGRGFTVTNNGNPPSAPIRESGGLKNLKEAAEALGAAARIGHAPAFTLTIEL